MKTPPRQDWISTSNADLRSTLDCHWRNGDLPDHLPALRATLAAIAAFPGQTTRRKTLERFIRRAQCRAGFIPPHRPIPLPENPF
ncbi:MAG: hypothetical protein IT447_15455 [Phycisphaerales bacterium]|nr:hypothetical protein [Phycisphaerales bacterium]